LQKNKMASGKTFQLSAHQLQAGSGKHNVDIEMTTKDYKKLVQNVGKNKGFRFTADKIVGSGFFKDIGKVIAKKVAPVLLDKIGEKTGQKGLTNALKGSVDGVVDFSADRISGGKMQKGSEEMKQHMARLRSMRKGKGVADAIDGGDIASDFRNFGRKVKRGFTKTFNPALGRKIKRALTSDVAKDIYKGVADIGIGAAGAFTGRPILASIGARAANAAIDGLGIVKGKPNTMVQGGTLLNGVPHVQIRKGKGFNSVSGVHYGEGVHGGSFKSPTSGGSFLSA
jgi:hypothetical protein